MSGWVVQYRPCPWLFLSGDPALSTWVGLADAAVYANRDDAALAAPLASVSSTCVRLILIEDLDANNMLHELFWQQDRWLEDDNGGSFFLSSIHLEELFESIKCHIDIRRPITSPSTDINAVRSMTTDPKGPLVAHLYAEVWHACCDALEAATAPVAD